ncbi:MAG: efflux transporter outer membrane subunit [Phycisphaeraceae bacterium]
MSRAQRPCAAALLFAAAVCGLAGCTVGPNYAPPEVAAPPAFGRRAPAPPAATSSAAISTLDAGHAQVVQWWTTLQDPELNRLIERAVEANLDLRLAEARLREARARLAVSQSATFPQVDTNAGYTRNRMSVNALPMGPAAGPGTAIPYDWNLYQLGFDASWELDLFGGVRRSIEAAQADLEAGEEDRRAVLVSILAEVARNYVAMRGLQYEYQIVRRNLTVQRETLELTTDQRNKGTATQLDVARAAAQVSTTEAVLPGLQNQQWQAMHRLAVLLGTGPEALIEELSTESPIPVPPSQVGVGLPSELLRRRPDIRRAERELAASTARIGVAVADLFPKFSLTGSFGLQSSDIGDLMHWTSRDFSIGPAMRWPIFDGGQLRAVVRVRTAQQEQALVRYQQTVLTALSEVEDAIVAYQTEQQRRQSLRQTVASSQEAADLADQLYRQGLTDFLTVLDAQRSLYQSQDVLAQSDRAVTINLIALYKALGGGWEMERPAGGAPGTAAGAAAGPASAAPHKIVFDVGQ